MLTSLPGQGAPEFSLGLINLLGTGLFPEPLGLHLLQVTVAPLKVPFSLQDATTWPLLCPISFQILQALVSSSFPGGRLPKPSQPRVCEFTVNSSPPFLPSSKDSLPKDSDGSLLLRCKAWKGQKVPLEGFCLKKQAVRRQLRGTCGPVPAHWKTNIPVTNFKADR